MRFGKRLAEITNGGLASEPYISYKDLKHIVAGISALISGDDELRADSSGEDDPEPFNHGAAGPSYKKGQGHLDSLSSRVAHLEKQFFRKIAEDCEQARVYIGAKVASIEIAVGEWQAAAIMAGILYTPAQLAEVASELSFKTSDPALLELLMRTKGPPPQEALASAVSKFNLVATELNSLQQYVEVNLMAVRKIFKKFDKKIPTEHRYQTTRDFVGHHELTGQPFQDILVAVHTGRQIVTSYQAISATLTQVGPETMILLPVPVRQALANCRGQTQSATIDVYAKPGADTGPPNHALRVSTSPAIVVLPEDRSTGHPGSVLARAADAGGPVLADSGGKATDASPKKAPGTFITSQQKGQGKNGSGHGQNANAGGKGASQQPQQRAQGNDGQDGPGKSTRGRRRGGRGGRGSGGGGNASANSNANANQNPGDKASAQGATGPNVEQSRTIRLALQETAGSTTAGSQTNDSRGGSFSDNGPAVSAQGSNGQSQTRPGGMMATPLNLNGTLNPQAAMSPSAGGGMPIFVKDASTGPGMMGMPMNINGAFYQVPFFVGGDGNRGPGVMGVPMNMNGAYYAQVPMQPQMGQVPVFVGGDGSLNRGPMPDPNQNRGCQIVNHAGFVQAMGAVGRPNNSC